MRKLALKTGATIATLMPVALAPRAFGIETPTAPITDPQGIVDIINTVAGWFFAVFLALAVVFLLWAAFQYLTAAGNQDRVDKAKNTLIYSVVAIVVALVAGGLVQVISGILDAGL